MKNQIMLLTLSVSFFLNSIDLVFSAEIQPGVDQLVQKSLAKLNVKIQDHDIAIYLFSSNERKNLKPDPDDSADNASTAGDYFLFVVGSKKIGSKIHLGKLAFSGTWAPEPELYEIGKTSEGGVFFGVPENQTGGAGIVSGSVYYIGPNLILKQVSLDIIWRDAAGYYPKKWDSTKNILEISCTPSSGAGCPDEGRTDRYKFDGKTLKEIR